MKQKHKRLLFVLSFLLSLILCVNSLATVTGTETPLKTYAGNGSTTEFPITFPYNSLNAAVVVYQHGGTGGAETPWTLNGSGNTGYTISDDTVIANVAPISGTYLVLTRDTPITQEVDLVPNRRYSAEILEGAYDKLTLIIQEYLEELGRAPKIAKSSFYADQEYTFPDPAASTVIGWDGAGSKLITLPLGGSNYTASTIRKISDYDNLEDFITEIGSTKCLLLMDTDAVLDKNLSVNVNTYINFIGGMINPNGFALAMDSPANIIASPTQQIFSGAVVFATGGIVEAGWWNSDNSETGINLAIVSANSAPYGGTVHVAFASTVSNTINILSNVILKSEYISTKFSANTGFVGPVIKIGTPSAEYTQTGLENVYVDITSGSDACVGIHKRSCNKIHWDNVYVNGKTGSVTQIGVIWGNGTHGYVGDLKVEGTKICLYLDNPTGQECHDTVFNKPWLNPNDIAGAYGIYSGDYASAGSGGNNLVTFINPYLETGSGGNAVGIGCDANGTSNWRIYAPHFDGTFLKNYGQGYPSRWNIYGAGDEDFPGSDLVRSNLHAKQITQIIEKFRLINAAGNTQMQVDASGFVLGDGGNAFTRVLIGSTTWDPGIVAAGDTATKEVAVVNANVGDMCFPGFDTLDEGGWQISAYIHTAGQAYVSITNTTVAPITVPEGTVKVTVFQ
jgi:hypothetical protein